MGQFAKLPYFNFQRRAWYACLNLQASRALDTYAGRCRIEQALTMDKPKSPSLRFIRSHVHTRQYRLTKHATIVRLERGIPISELEQALLNGRIIEQYPDDQPYPSCLVFGSLPTGDPLHIVCSRGDVEPALRIVTLYEPEEALWEGDFKSRK